MYRVLDGGAGGEAGGPLDEVRHVDAALEEADLPASEGLVHLWQADVVGSAVVGGEEDQRVVGVQAWLYGVDGVGPSRAGIFGNLIPVSALLFSFVILGEPVGFREISGIGLIVLGVWLVNQRAQAQQTKDNDGEEESVQC